MAKKILMGASFLALLAAFPAFAQTMANSADTTHVEANATTDTSLGAKVDGALDRVEKSVTRTADMAKVVTKEKYNDVKAYFSDEKDMGAMTTVNVGSRLTASELIGADILDPQGKSVGKVDDILVNADGDVERVIVKDGGAMGLGGKLVSVDYDDFDKLAGDQKVALKLSDAEIKSAKAYDYKANAAENLFRVSKIIGSKVVDMKGKNVAKVENVAFEGDEADYAIVSFDKILGMGGEKAALDFEALDLVNNQGKYAFKLNAQQSAQFTNYKQTTKTN